MEKDKVNINSNCSKCMEYFQDEWAGGDLESTCSVCICRKCPRNLAKCIITKWCSETESALYL